ncbi:MAG: N-acetyl-gamma-glutamyl-phosphate reductase [Christensenellaceae bacterium]|nr:N-acetyl-gamma-glutamyl-phosphate reductase [Christensenellaceae bacterium]
MRKLFIDGQAGTTGLQIRERLLNRKDVELLDIPQSYRKNLDMRAKCINESDIAILCLPDQSAREVVALASSNVTIVDASTAHRTASGWVYGFPELGDVFKTSIVKSNRIAVPGCHACGFISIVYPLIHERLLSNDADLSCFSLTGYSGGGKQMIAEYEDDKNFERLNAPRLYAIGQEHKHLREMQIICGLKNKPIFNPIVCNYYNGMATTVPIFSKNIKGLSASELTDFYLEYYSGDECRISVKPSNEVVDNSLSADILKNSDKMTLCVSGVDGRLSITALFDNLGMGAAGSAEKCINLIMTRDGGK